MQKLASWILKIWGWKIKGSYAQFPKVIVAIVPHTSNWDFPIGLLVRSALKAPINFMIKKSWTKGPVGWVINKLGAVAIDRTKSENFVDATVRHIKSVDRFVLNIAPEGTRKKVDRLKTGFYYIALKAEIPIVLGTFDWKNKIIDLSPVFYPTGDFDKDMDFINQRYAGIEGRIPENSYLIEGYTPKY